MLQPTELLRRLATLVPPPRPHLVRYQVAEFQAAVLRDDDAAVATAAIALATKILESRFFAPRKLPNSWPSVLSEWVKGSPFADILKGKGTRDAQAIQAFVQDTVVFRLVWGAEAARVQAIAGDHRRAGELGDGPAFALTYGVPTIPAGLLSQTGFASRSGALWVTRQLSASFTDMAGLHLWLGENDEALSDPDFWDTRDHWLLWERGSRRGHGEYPRRWKREQSLVPVKWFGSVPAENCRVRLIPGGGKTVAVCGKDLMPVGSAHLAFNGEGAFLDGIVTADRKVSVTSFRST